MGTRCCLAKQPFHHVTVHVSQAITPALEKPGQPFMVDAELVEDRCVQIVHRHFIANGPVAEFIGLSEIQPGLETATGDQLGKAVRMMVAFVICFHLAGLAERRAPNWPLA